MQKVEEDVADGLRARIEQLRYHPQLTQELADTIRRGEVDCLVTDGADGDPFLALEDVHSTYRAFVEEMHQGAVTLGPDGTILYCNRSFAAILRAATEAVVGSRLDRFVKPGDKDRVVRLLDRAGEDQASTEFHLVGAGGIDVPVAVTRTHLLLKGALTATCLVVTDLTERKRTEAELQRACAYNRSLIEASLDPLVTKGPDGKITDVNKATEIATGLTRAQLIGSDFVDYFTEPEKARQLYEQAFREGSVRDYSLELRGAGGRITPVVYNASVYRDEAGRVIGVFAAARDISERKKTEEALQQAREAEEANRVKSRFLATLSHELRTPLNAIVGFTGMLLMKLSGPLNPDQEQQLQSVEDSANHLLSLINDVLDLAKVEAGKVDLKPERVDCQQLVAEVFQNLEPLAAAKGLRLVSVPSGGGQVLRTDRRSVLQILLNLVNNAIKFSERGEIRVRCEDLCGVNPRAVQIRIADTGIGIRPEDQARLFQPFEQAGPTSCQPNSRGTGLGLHLSRKLAQLLGGHITLESTYGLGSTVTLTLPEMGDGYNPYHRG